MKLLIQKIEEYVLFLTQLNILFQIEFAFDHITLGHSGFLMTWKPCVRLNEDQSPKYFKFSARINDSKNDNVSFNEVQICSSTSNQCKIHSLKENTRYDVIIQQYPHVMPLNESYKEVE